MLILGLGWACETESLHLCIQPSQLCKERRLLKKLGYSKSERRPAAPRGELNILSGWIDEGCNICTKHVAEGCRYGHQHCPSGSDWSPRP